jgi:hypothetical protein
MIKLIILKIVLIVKIFTIELISSLLESIKKTYILFTGKIACFIYGFLVTVYISGLFLDKYNAELKMNMQNQGIDASVIDKIFTKYTRKENANN